MYPDKKNARGVSEPVPGNVILVPVLIQTSLCYIMVSTRVRHYRCSAYVLMFLSSSFGTCPREAVRRYLLRSFRTCSSP